MAENQNIEYKEVWKDEYLKWVCGFANAQGGTLYIGVADDGTVVGLADAKRLQEELPNKMRDVLGLIVDLTLHESDGKEYLEIGVPASSFAVNYNGEYHYRSGATRQQLKGAALNAFLLRKSHTRWDELPVDGVSANDLDKDSLALFRRLMRGGRNMPLSRLEAMSDDELLRSLHLYTADGKLKRAALLLFHEDPEIWFTGAYIKIARFVSETDFIYQDEIHGSLIQQTERVFDLLFSKYLYPHVAYEGIHRVERLPLPEEAVREGVLNALMHRAYEDGAPLQIRIYNDKVTIGNSYGYNADITPETIQLLHESRPYNPDIANAFFRAGYIESWGRGIEKLIVACTDYGCSTPYYLPSGPRNIRLVMPTSFVLSGQKNELVPELVPQNLALIHEPDLKPVYDLIVQSPSITIDRIAELLSISKRTVNRRIAELKAAKLICRTGPTFSGQWRAIEIENGGQYCDRVEDNVPHDVSNHVPKDVPNDLSDRCREILSTLTKEPTLTGKDLAQRFNVSVKTIRRDLQLMKQQGLVTREGSHKKGRWIVQSSK